MTSVPLPSACSLYCFFFFLLCKSSHLFKNHHIFPPFASLKKKRKRRCVSRGTKGLFHRLGLTRSRPDIVKNTTLAVCLQHCSLNLTEFKMSDIQHAVHCLVLHGMVKLLVAPSASWTLSAHKQVESAQDLQRALKRKAQARAWTFHQISIKALSPPLISPFSRPFHLLNVLIYSLSSISDDVSDLCGAAAEAAFCS